MLYDLFFIIFSILYLPYFLISGKWRSFDRQRLGKFPADLLVKIADSNAVWLHAVSVGEVIASVPLYEELRKNFPREKIIVSTVTPTGNKIARERFKDAAAVIYLPLDLSWVTNKVVKLIRPKAVLIAETEIWPNFITSLNGSGARVIIFNGRVSKNSFRNYGIVRPLLKRILRRVDLYLMQSASDAEKMTSLGAPEEKVKVTGNLKYDAVLTARATGASQSADENALRKKLGLGSGEKLFIAGSTHPGEEEALLRCYKELTLEFPGLRLLIAPRHVDRAARIASLANEAGFDSRMVSETDGNTLARHEVLILDDMGTLARLYSAGDIVFIGGSLIKKGGQNPLEAAYYSKPILFGPHMHNFEEIANNLILAKAAVKVDDETGLINALRGLLKNDYERGIMGENARKVLEANAGAAKKDLALITIFIPFSQE